MKRKISILMNIVILFTMCVMFASCGKKDSKNDTELIIGDWECEIDITDIMKNAFLEVCEFEEDAQYFDFKNLSVKLNMHFDEDGTCTVEFDKNSIEKCNNDLFIQSSDGVIVMMEEWLGTSMPDADRVELKRELKDSTDLALLDEWYAPWSDKGRGYGPELVTKYYFEDDYLILHSSEVKYKLSEDKLLIKSGNPVIDSRLDYVDFLLDLTPLEFKRK